MLRSMLFLLVLSLPPGLLAAAGSGTPATTQKSGTSYYLIANNDLPWKVGATSGTIFTISSDGTPLNPSLVTLGGAGAAGGYFTSNRVSVLQSSTDACAYLSLGGASEIAAVDILNMQDLGNYSGSSTDLGRDNGVGLVNNGTYLYASFSTSSTLATFAVLPGCGLTFLGDISPLGKQSGNVKGMAIHGTMLVIAYGDGSIESFNISGGIPVSNGDLQYATGYVTSRFPTGVDITQDGHYAIFGDMATYATVEVSDISSGKLTRTALYNVGKAGNSNNIFLSPDETLLYIGNTGNGKVTAAFFDAKTGKVKPGCVSAQLKGFDNTWTFLSTVMTELNTGTGSVLYATEFGSSSGMAMLNVTSSGGKCSLTEAPNSPVIDPYSTFLLSIGVYPPRQF